MCSSQDSLSSSPHTQNQRTVVINDGNPRQWSTCSNSYSKTLVPLKTNVIINDVKTGTPCGGRAAEGEGDGACGRCVVPTLCGGKKMFFYGFCHLAKLAPS